MAFWEKGGCDGQIVIASESLLGGQAGKTNRMWRQTRGIQLQTAVGEENREREGGSFKSRGRTCAYI